MRFVNPSEGGLIWPGESVTHTPSADGALLDTGWMINWPGPGQLYLSDGDLVDILIPATERQAVKDALASAGWTAPGETASAVAQLEANLADVEQQLADAQRSEQGFAAAMERLDVFVEEHQKKAAAKPAAAKKAKGG